MLGPLYFENGDAVLETAWYLINSEWPSLRDIFSPPDYTMADEEDGGSTTSLSGTALSRHSSPQALDHLQHAPLATGKSGFLDEDVSSGTASPVRDYKRAPLATSVHNTPAQPVASPLQVGPGLLGALMETTNQQQRTVGGSTPPGRRASGASASSSRAESPSRARPPPLEAGFEGSGQEAFQRSSSSSPALSPQGAPAERSGSSIDGAGIGMGLAQHHKMTSSGVVVGTGAASSSRFVPPKRGGEKIQFASLLLGNFEKRTLALKLFSSLLYITLIPAETVVRFLDFDPFDGQEPSKNAKSPLASAVLSMFGFSSAAGEGERKRPRSSKSERRRSDRKPGETKSGSVASSKSASPTSSRQPPSQKSSPFGVDHPAPPGGMTATATTGSVPLSSSFVGGSRSPTASGRRSSGSPIISGARPIMIGGGTHPELSPKKSGSFLGSLPLSESFRVSRTSSKQSFRSDTRESLGTSPKHSEEEDDEDPRREILALRTTFDASTLQFRDWVFPKWALCPSLEGKSACLRDDGMPSFLAHYLGDMNASSPVNDVRRTGVLSMLSTTTSAGGPGAGPPMDSPRALLEVLPSPRAGEAGSKNTGTSGTSTARTRNQSSLGQALSRALSIPIEPSSTGSDDFSEEGRGEASSPTVVSPRKHSVTFGGPSAELRALSKSLEAQAYDGAAWNLWTRLAEFGPEMLWTLWSLALTGDPLVVYGNSHVVDDAVYGFAQLIKPLEFRCDYRPHFTVYDPEFKNRTGMMPTVAGCANPAIFAELTRETAPYYRGATSASGGTKNGIQKFSGPTNHGAGGGAAVVGAGVGRSSSSTSNVAPSNGTRTGGSSAVGGAKVSSLRRARTEEASPAGGRAAAAVRRSSDAAWTNGTQGKTPPGINAQPSKVSSLILGQLEASDRQVLDLRPGNFRAPKILCRCSQLYTEFSGPIGPDKELLNRLLPPTNHSSIMINNFILCQYFYELTCTFLKPFLRYLVANASVLKARSVGKSGSTVVPRSSEETLNNANDSFGPTHGIMYRKDSASGAGGTITSGEESTKSGTEKTEVSNLLKSSQLRRSESRTTTTSKSSDQLLEICESFMEVELSEKATKDLEDTLVSHYFMADALPSSVGDPVVSGGPATRVSSASSSSDRPQSSPQPNVAAAGAAPTKTRTLLPAFTSQEFFKHLEVEGVFRTAPTQKVRKLYLRFINSPHFEPWFRKQRDEVVREALRVAKAVGATRATEKGGGE